MEAIMSAEYTGVISAPEHNLEMKVQAVQVDDRVKTAKIEVYRIDTGEPVTTLNLTELTVVRQLYQGAQTWLETLDYPFKVQVLSMKRIDVEGKH